MTALRTGIVVVVLGLGLVGLLAGDAATVGVGRAPSEAAKTASWTEVKWPFPLDQWGIGRAYMCKPADCGIEVNIYFRPKIGFCKCETGVNDDEELDRVSDNELLASKPVALGPGRPIEVGWMKGRSRVYQVSDAARVLSIAFNDRCDVIVALATLGAGDREVLEPAVLAFLNSERVQRWVKWLLL